MGKIEMILKNPKLYMIYALGRLMRGSVVADRRYLEILYRYKFKKPLNIENPQTYNEKLQWLKLYDRRPEYTVMVDKYLVKQYVADKIGDKYIIPTLGVWDRFEDIDFDKLPDEFVLKCTHDSGGLVICTDIKKLDKDNARKTINHSLKRNYFLNTREWPYKNVQPRIIAEQYMVDESGYELKDYKFFCFDGVPKAMFVASDRGIEGEETKFDFFDMDFQHLPFINGHPNANKEIACPKSFDEMKRLAAILSKGLPQTRIDFYDINGSVYFGEITFYHWSGLVPFEPEAWDHVFGSWISLPQKER